MMTSPYDWQKIIFLIIYMIRVFFWKRCLKKTDSYDKNDIYL